MSQTLVPPSPLYYTSCTPIRHTSPARTARVPGCPPWLLCRLPSGPLPPNGCSCLFTDVGSVEGLAYHRGWDTLYWTSYTTSTITRHTVDQTRPGAFERETVITMSGDDHPRAFVLDECQK